MKIEVWSDFVCPFCYIGKRRLELALEQVAFKEDVEVEFKSFELDANAPLYNGVSIDEMIAAKYGISIEQAQQNNKQLGKQAQSLGLNFNFEEMKPTNTFDAHRLAKFAESKGKSVTETLLHAYFTESQLISDTDVLVDLAEKVGLDKQETLAVLQNKTAFSNDVRIDESIAQQYGISGVPYFIINRKYSISGAQPLEVFVNALQQIWEEENQKPVLKSFSSETTNEGICTDTDCTIPTKE